jgi:hypothetical protein
MKTGPFIRGPSVDTLPTSGKNQYKGLARLQTELDTPYYTLFTNEMWQLIQNFL